MLTGEAQVALPSSGRILVPQLAQCGFSAQVPVELAPGAGPARRRRRKGLGRAHGGRPCCRAPPRPVATARSSEATLPFGSSLGCWKSA
jgi:hypothetical protein